MSVSRAGERTALLRRYHDLLLLPAHDGAHLAALRCLHEAANARDAYLRDTSTNVATENDPHTHNTVAHNTSTRDGELRVLCAAIDALHTTLREHRRLLRDAVRSSMRRTLRDVDRSANAAYRAVTQRQWIDAERDSLTPAAQRDADIVIVSLAAQHDLRCRHLHAALEQFDVLATALHSALLTCVVRRPVGQPLDGHLFAMHVAERLTGSTQRLQSTLAELHSESAGSEPAAKTARRLRRVGRTLHRHCVLLAPLHHAHPALAAWYATAAQGRDMLIALCIVDGIARQAESHTLVALSREARATADALRHAFLGAWGTAAPHVTRAHEQLRAALHEMAATTLGTSVADTSLPHESLPMEYEAKFLLREAPTELSVLRPTLIEQGWLPGTRLRERVRRSVMPNGSIRLTRTVKLGPIDARIEIEEDTDTDLFSALWPLTAAARIRKHRYAVVDGTLTWEIDVFLDRALVVAEVELPNAAMVPAVPAWLAPYIVCEVTHDPAYLNAVLARAEQNVLMDGMAT